MICSSAILAPSIQKKYSQTLPSGLALGQISVSLQNIRSDNGGVKWSVLIVTSLFILLGSGSSAWLLTAEPYLVLGMMLILGLPHGATDHGLFQLLRSGDSTKKQRGFYLFYFSVLASYGLLWWIFPALAFLIFIIISIYHFGQSNWIDVKYGSQGLARAHFFLWGAGVLLTPILLYAPEAAEIVATMTGTSWHVPATDVVFGTLGILAIANLFFLLYLHWYTDSLGGHRLFKEILGYGLLMALFYTNSLLLGFTVYFVFWHSLASATDQFRFFRKRLDPTLRRRLFLEIGLVVGGAAISCAAIWFGQAEAVALSPKTIGRVFIFISLLTLPHMLLVEELYAQWSPSYRPEDQSFPAPRRESGTNSIHQTLQ